MLDLHVGSHEPKWVRGWNIHQLATHTGGWPADPIHFRSIIAGRIPNFCSLLCPGLFVLLAMRQGDERTDGGGSDELVQTDAIQAGPTQRHDYDLLELLNVPTKVN